MSAKVLIADMGATCKALVTMAESICLNDPDLVPRLHLDPVKEIREVDGAILYRYRLRMTVESLNHPARSAL